MPERATTHPLSWCAPDPDRVFLIARLDRLGDYRARVQAGSPVAWERTTLWRDCLDRDQMPDARAPVSDFDDQFPVRLADLLLASTLASARVSALESTLQHHLLPQLKPADPALTRITLGKLPDLRITLHRGTHAQAPRDRRHATWI